MSPSDRSFVQQAALVLLATRVAATVPEAVETAAEIASLARTLQRRGAHGREIPEVSLRASRVLERMGLADLRAGSPSFDEVDGALCEAHLLAQRSCGQVNLRELRAWFVANGKALPATCGGHEPRHGEHCRSRREARDGSTPTLDAASNEAA